MLSFEVYPETSLKADKWELTLGMHFSQAVKAIQQQVGTIRGVEVIYNGADPLDNDLIMVLTNDGIKLHFESASQKLKVIEVFNMMQVELRYCQTSFNSSGVKPIIEQIDSTFGATRLPEFDPEENMLIINFPGLAFYFKIDEKYLPDVKKDASSLRFPSGYSPVVSKMLLYKGEQLSEASPPEMPISCMNDKNFLTSLQVLRENEKTKGIRIQGFHKKNRLDTIADKEITDVELHFGSSCQDVVTALGEPQGKFYKSEDKMKIHNAQARKAVSRSDYFFNYFTLGLDILFDAKTQKVKKFVLHTNFPGHYNFNMYHRCFFELPITVKRSPNDNTCLIDVPISMTVQSVTLWETLASRIRPRGGPVVLHRSSSNSNTSNPFGSTYCYAYQDIIFEVMANGHIAAVTLFDSEDDA